MEACLLKHLKRIVSSGAGVSKQAGCQELISQLESAGSGGGDNDADKYFGVLRLVCESRQPRAMELALDGIAALIEHGFLRGKSLLPPASTEPSAPILQAASDDSAISGTLSTSNSGNSLSIPTASRTLMDQVVETVSKCSDEFDDGVQLQVIKVLLTAVTSAYCEVREASLLMAVRACFHINLISKNQVNKTTAKAALTQMLSAVNVKMEVADANLRADREDGASGGSNSDPSSDAAVSPGSLLVAAAPANFASAFHRDSFLLFRALCKLSMKGLQEDDGAGGNGGGGGTQGDHIAMQNKILSLELILHIVQRSGPAFRSGERFIYVIRTYLCVSLLHNCTSAIAQVTGLSLQIFVALMDGFKDHLKSELEVFFTNIFLKILESENSTYEHKQRVLEVFHSICRDPRALVELFVNYDCDLDAIDLFRRIVDGFAKIAKNPSIPKGASVGMDFLSSSSSRKAFLEEQTLRKMGLQGFVIILRSLLRSRGLPQEEGDLPHVAVSAVESSANNHGGGGGDEDAGTDGPVEGREAIENSAVNVFDRKQRMQEELETGILKFNLNPKKGLSYLASVGHIEMTPKSVAIFFHQLHDRLNKTTIGDYLGREREYENGFCLKVLHEYVDAMDFQDMAFDLAIRHFLSGFRLPGEAQKIDRIMEKFAERYYLQNRKEFASADMAFILAFSTIMLQTNLHNPAIREDKRMTKEQFIKQNKGISSDGELSDELLIEIYDRIAAEPISITESSADKKKSQQKKDSDQATSSFGVFQGQVSTDKRRKDAFNEERKEMLQAGEALFRTKKMKSGKAFVRHSALNLSEDGAYVRPMFEVAWAPIIGVLSQLLETYDDEATIELCLSGFQSAIRLACRLDFSIGRGTFINALAKFTALDAVREMRYKNVECIKLLVNITLTEGDFLDESWNQMLQCISQIARLQLFANGLHTDDMFFSDAASRAQRGQSTDAFSKLFSGPSRAETARLIEEANAVLVASEINTVVIDRVFLNSQMLSDEGVQHFVKSLCAVSIQEISSSSSMNSLRGKEVSGDTATPRVFSLQKLVEVADFNMHSRSRIAWTNIWSLLAHHFTSVGVHENLQLAMYAIDSLKQLSIKFLQKEELSNFNFQRFFLKPFDVIIARSRSSQIKELVLRCIDVMILACAGNIRSGWRSIFAIFEASASQDVPEIAAIAFEITERLLDQFDLLIFDFVELMNCLVAFAASTYTTLSLRAVALLERCANFLGKLGVEGLADNLLASTTSSSAGSTPSTPSFPSSSLIVAIDPLASTSTVSVNKAQINEDTRVFRLWWPLLLGLSTRVADTRVQVRIRALEALNLILRSHGHLFSPQAWAVIFRGVLFPIIDSAKTDTTQQSTSKYPSENPELAAESSQSWIGTVGLKVLTICLELFLQFQVQNGETFPLLPDLLSMLEGCICQDTESLAKLSIRTFGDLILSLGSLNNELIDKASADLICSRLCGSMLSNLCLDFGPAGKLTFVKETPPRVTNQYIPFCPLALRRTAKEGAAIIGDIGTNIFTSFGEGTVVEALPRHDELDLPPRRVVKLPWGNLFIASGGYSATMSTMPFSSREESGDYGLLSAPRLTENQAWARLAASSMTSMVVSLDFIRLTGKTFEEHFSSFGERHHEALLEALEASHWHARSFNEDQRLRIALQARRFMTFPNAAQPPHLLEQEVASAGELVNLATCLYAQPAFEKFAETWVRRYCLLVCNRYMDLDLTLHTTRPMSLDLITAYKPAVMTVLRSVYSFPQKQFLACSFWIAPLITRLILSSEHDIRIYVSLLHEKLSVSPNNSS